ncbi:MAG: beta-ketoacyl-[acyl-carrier-protein] synthase family protein, partial [Abitibacteriaceae bacterium]|nr:beta-ketoacyl-[acyl-carrier-protein] synthase family protein [Abditibacteriaceae bacterium]
MKHAVITGIGIVSPFGLGWKRWVSGLQAGLSATRPISLFDPRFPQAAAFGDDAYAQVDYQTSYKKHIAPPLPCQVAAEVPDFQPHAWISERDYDRVPRVVPLALAATHEALETAGLDTLSAAEKEDVHVVIGSGGGGFSFAEEQFAHWFGSTTRQLSPYSVSSSIAGMVSSEISIAHGLRGRSHTISNGCTSSTDALGTSLDLIRSGRAHTVISGGADGPITPGTIAAFCLMRAVPTKYNDCAAQASRPFDRDRDGFVLGEGAWIYVVEELEHARARGAKLWAEIAGYGSTCEAYHRVALGTPDEAARAMRLAFKDADVPPEAVDYANLHGTGTNLNDPLETAAVKIALGANAYHTPMSATKSQIGHPQGASGAAGIAATLAA